MHNARNQIRLGSLTRSRASSWLSSSGQLQRYSERSNQGFAPTRGNRAASRSCAADLWQPIQRSRKRRNQENKPDWRQRARASPLRGRCRKHSRRDAFGYHIEATDGPIGSVSSFMVDDKSWAIRELVVETGHWYSGKEILISPSKIERISHEEPKVFVNLSKADIQGTGEKEGARARAEKKGAKNPRH